MKTTQLNHVALHVADVDRSCDFYRRIMGLDPLPRPAFSFPGAWFRIGVDQELHLIGGRKHDPVAGSRGNHWAMMIDDMDEWESFLRDHRIPMTDRRSRPDGAFQIFVTDPDGHVIELCTAPGVTNGLTSSDEC